MAAAANPRLEGTGASAASSVDVGRSLQAKEIGATDSLERNSAGGERTNERTEEASKFRFKATERASEGDSIGNAGWLAGWMAPREERGRTDGRRHGAGGGRPITEIISFPDAMGDGGTAEEGVKKGGRETFRRNFPLPRRCRTSKSVCVVHDRVGWMEV